MVAPEQGSRLNLPNLDLQTSIFQLGTPTPLRQTQPHFDFANMMGSEKHLSIGGSVGKHPQNYIGFSPYCGPNNGNGNWFKFPMQGPQASASAMRYNAGNPSLVGTSPMPAVTPYVL